jgi:hypothetical protein
MKPNRGRFHSASTFAAAFALCLSSAAQAETEAKRTRIALDVDYAVALGEGDTDGGAGGALRLGYELDLATVAVTPEIGLGYHGFGGLRSPGIYQAFVGARTGFGGVLEPGLYARFGVAHASEEGGSRTVPSLGAGLSLDLTPVPVLDIGVHSGYEVLFAGGNENAFDWWVFGAHAAVMF